MTGNSDQSDPPGLERTIHGIPDPDAGSICRKGMAIINFLPVISYKPDGVGILFLIIQEC
jgi:hypothetical protein